MSAKFSTIFIGLVVAISMSFANAQAQEGGGFFKKKPVEVAAPASTAAGSTGSIESAPKPIGSKVTPGWVIGGNSGSKASAPTPAAPIPLPSQASNGARPPPAAPMPIPQEKKQSAGSSKTLAQANVPKQSPKPKVKTMSKADAADAPSPVAAASETTPIAIVSTARPALAAASDPRAACSGQNFIVAIVCVSIKCELPNFKNHAECVKLRAQNDTNRIIPSQKFSD